jgi:hypothetical protein
LAKTSVVRRLALSPPGPDRHKCPNALEVDRGRAFTGI